MKKVFDWVIAVLAVIVCLLTSPVVSLFVSLYRGFLAFVEQYKKLWDHAMKIVNVVIRQ